MVLIKSRMFESPYHLVSDTYVITYYKYPYLSCKYRRKDCLVGFAALTPPCST